MKKRLFLQIFSLTLFSALLIFVFGVVSVKQNAKSIVNEKLDEETRIVCAFVSTSDDYSEIIKYRKDVALRITVIDLNGNVLFDSNTSAKLENHLDREEVKNALNDTPRVVERYSETLGADMAYYALKTEDNGGNTVVVRLAVRGSRIDEYLGITIPVFSIVLVVSLIVSFVVSDVLSKKIANKVTDIGNSLKSLNDGTYTPIKTDSSEPELYGVLNEINELNENTRQYIAGVRAERAKLDAVLENVSQGIIAVDEKNKIVFVNESALSIFDGTADIIGKDLVYLIDDMSLLEKIPDITEDNYSTERNYKGRVLSFMIKKAEKDAFDFGVSFIIVITDITEEKEIARQKSDFFANASHELKTPVAVMQGLSELLLTKDCFDETTRKRIDRIHGESIRLASLIEDMLKLSKLETVTQKDRITSVVDLEKITKEVFGELSTIIEEKSISVDVEGNGKIVADERDVYELIQNICTNAVNYNKPDGSVTVYIEDAESTVTLKVADTGIGIDKESLPRLCERFYRVDKSRSKKTGGTGLGLAIVKHICVLYGASLNIESVQDRGTVVTVTFFKR